MADTVAAQRKISAAEKLELEGRIMGVSSSLKFKIIDGTHVHQGHLMHLGGKTSEEAENNTVAIVCMGFIHWPDKKTLQGVDHVRVCGRFCDVDR